MTNDLDSLSLLLTPPCRFLAKPNVRSERVLRKKALGIMLIPIKLLTLSSSFAFFFLIRVFKLSLSLRRSNGLISLHTYIAVKLNKTQTKLPPFFAQTKRERESIYYVYANPVLNLSWFWDLSICLYDQTLTPFAGLSSKASSSPPHKFALVFFQRPLREWINSNLALK